MDSLGMFWNYTSVHLVYLVHKNKMPVNELFSVH